MYAVVPLGFHPKQNLERRRGFVKYNGVIQKPLLCSLRTKLIACPHRRIGKPINPPDSDFIEP
jgi:hypothetical protein